MVQVDKGLQWGNKTKVIQVDLGTFTYILAYSGLFRALCNPAIFKTLVYSKSETKAYLEPCQISSMEPFVKIVNSYSYFHKIK